MSIAYVGLFFVYLGLNCIVFGLKSIIPEPPEGSSFVALSNDKIIALNILEDCKYKDGRTPVTIVTVQNKEEK